MMIRSKTIDILKNKGVQIPCPDSVMIDDEVKPERISGDNVILYPGTRLFGPDTLISRGCHLGFESPVTLENSYLGPDIRLKGGFFQGAAFAGQNSFGSGAHVREGTILEEQANAAHTVGLKQTILFPFVTLGSLINFCDCLMAGGTSRSDHSEVGSSFIHFNYTPNQDKATPSLLGNVHQGVMLRSRPIFLGGQGGLVGPRKIAFGCVTAAGTICRKDELRPDRLIFGGAVKSGSIARQEGIYLQTGLIWTSNCSYIASLMALKYWYKHVRSLFVTDFFSAELVQGLLKTIDNGIQERIKRLEGFCDRLNRSRELLLAKNQGKISDLTRNHDRVLAIWPRARDRFDREKENMGHVQNAPPAVFLAAVNKSINVYGRDYIRVIKGLDDEAVAAGEAWLETIENQILSDVSLQLE
ncbi:MAG: protein GlmU [Pseudomonadota bacterium]